MTAKKKVVAKNCYPIVCALLSFIFVPHNMFVPNIIFDTLDCLLQFVTLFTPFSLCEISTIEILNVFTSHIETWYKP